jgi:hypothetical protein
MFLCLRRVFHHSLQSYRLSFDSNSQKQTGKRRTTEETQSLNRMGPKYIGQKRRGRVTPDQNPVQLASAEMPTPQASHL